MRVAQIKEIIVDDLGLGLNGITQAPMINMIITDLENPIFVDRNTRLKFVELSEDDGVLEVYYGEERNGNFIPFALGPNMTIPFSNIYGFRLQEVQS